MGCDERGRAGAYLGDFAQAGSRELLEPLVRALPLRRDQIDQQLQVVHARMAFRQKVAFESLEAADHLVHQSAHLRKVAGARAEMVLQSLGEGDLHLGGGERQGLERLPGAGERRLDLGRLRPSRLQLLLRTLDRFHGRGDYGGRRTMKVSELEYNLPTDLVAQHPVERRDESRLLVYERATGHVRHRVFRELPDELAGELVVVNDSRVLPARIPIDRPRGEVLLLERLRADEWEGLARPTRRLRAGTRYGDVELLEYLGEGRWRMRVHGEPAGEAPLPPYITEPLTDPERYQTVYARERGSAAAPTAGLHFTAELLARLDVERVTLHVGLDTFRPVAVEELEQHELHGERYDVRREAWERIRAAERVLAVGTTTTRVLETLARGAPLQGRTSLFITPGFEFRRVDALLTNFHLPRSTLLALVMAFAGVEETRRLYELAVRERYRFYSFGDAMLIL